MKKHKKILAILLALAFLFSIVAPSAVAGQTRFGDVAGENLSKSIERLVNLEILTGYPDGTFKPDNAITRAEFAAVAVRSLGLDVAAQSASGSTIFADVPATHWASGFINVAVQQGIINGYPDGTFKPGNNVTHAEALAMMVRLLGYEDTTIGTWPTKYLVKAAQLGINKGVNVVANAQATRAEVAFIADNALDAPMWVISETSDGRKIFREGETLLERSLRVIKVESAIVTNTPLFDDSLKANEVRLAAGNLANGTGIYYSRGSSTPDRIAAGKYVISVPNLDARQLMIGQEVDLWVRDANRDGQLQSNENVVIALESVSEVVAGFVREVKDGRVELKDGSRHTLSANNTRIVYNLNNSAANIATYTGNDNALDAINPDTGLSIKNAYVSILKDSNNRVATISALRNEGRLGNSLIVDTVDVSKQELRVKQPFSTSTSRIDLERFKVHVNKNGKFVDFADLKEGDVVNIYESPGSAVLILATDNTVEGKFVRVNTGGISGMGTIVLSDQNVPVARVAGYRETGKTSVAATDTTVLAGFADNDVTIKLNAFGQAVFVEGKRTTTSNDVVVIASERFDGSLNHGKIKVFNMEGEEVVYEYRNATVGNQFHPLPAGPNVAMRQVITLSLNSAGRVDTGSDLDPVTNNAAVSNGNLTRIDKDNSRIQVGGAFRNANSNTKIIDATSGNSSDWKVYTWEQFKSTPNPDAATTVATTYKVNSNNVLDYVVIRTVTGGPAWVVSAGDEMFGIITARSQAGSDHYVTVNVQGTVTTYKATGNQLALVANGSAIEFRLNAKGELEAAAAFATRQVRDVNFATHPHVRTINASARTLSLEASGGGTTWYTLAEDVQVFDNTTLVSLADLEASTTRDDATKVSVLTSSNPNHTNVVKVIIIQQKPVVAGPGAGGAPIPGTMNLAAATVSTTNPTIATVNLPAGNNEMYTLRVTRLSNGNVVNVPVFAPLANPVAYTHGAFGGALGSVSDTLFVQLLRGTDVLQSGTVTVDTVVPTLSAQGASTITDTTATISITSSKAGQVYYVLVPDGDVPSAAQVRAGQRSDGSAALRAGSAASTAAVATNINLTALTADTKYDVFFVAEDAALNRSLISTKVDLDTLASASLGNVANMTVAHINGAPANVGTATITLAADFVGALGADITADVTITGHGPLGATVLVEVDGANRRVANVTVNGVAVTPGTFTIMVPAAQHGGQHNTVPVTIEIQ